MFWAYGSYVGARVLSLVAIAILARLLSPLDFGIVAIALIAIAFLDLLSGLGLGEALVVVDEHEVEEKAETVFAVSVAVGLVSAAALAALGPVMASFFAQPQLVELMPVLGVTFVLRGLAGTHAALTQKRLDFRSRTTAELAEATVRGAISIILALLGAGVWSLVFGYVAGSAAWAITLWILVPWRPRFHPRRAHLRDLLSFGGTLTGVGVMAAFLTQFDNVVVGRVLGAVQLGFYSMATRTPELLILGLANVAGRVLFPAFATLRDDDVPRAFLAALRYTSIVTIPLALSLAVFAEPITVLLLGDRWRPSIGAMQVLCIWVGAATIGQVCGSVFKGRNRVDIVLLLAVPQAIALVIGTLALVDRGIVAVAWVQVGVVLCALVAAIAIAQRIFGFAPQAVVDTFRPTVIAAAALLAVLIGAQRTFADALTTVIVGAGVGAVVYLGLVALLAPDAVTTLKKAFAGAPPAGDHTPVQFDPE